jgi:asparagine synthase (glutamine-hydrolysing)
MCGIFGGLGDAPAETWTRMADALRHRGPDGEALRVDRGVALGLVRLAIVAPKEPGQVFTSGSVAAVMNGEIYNHRALRRGLEVPGQSDAALVPALFARDGAAFVHALEGPFAIALHDGASLHLVRDRLGKKPLHFVRVGRKVFFASEQKALLRVPGFEARVDPAVSQRFLERGFLDDDELLWVGLDRVAPGEWVTVRRGGRVERRRWWTLEQAASRRTRTQQLGAHLRRAVECRVPDEVPAALLLSGGLDSTLVGAALGERVRSAFCMESPGAGDATLARRAAKALGLSLEVVPLAPPSIEAFRRAAAHVEQPDAYSSWAMAPAVLQLGSAVRASGARVALMGEGADELFLGYAWDLLQASLERGDGALPADARRLLGDKARYFGLAHAQARLFSKTPRARDVWLQLASGVPAPQREWTSDFSGARQRQLMGLGRDMLTLPVLHADRLLMASGVEARMPFLDHRLVEVALRLPADSLEVAGIDKPLLRELAARWIPNWKPPPKKGFSAAAAPDEKTLRSMARALSRHDGIAVPKFAWKSAARHPHLLWRHVVLEETARAVLG